MQAHGKPANKKKVAKVVVVKGKEAGRSGRQQARKGSGRTASPAGGEADAHAAAARVQHFRHHEPPPMLA